MPSAPIMRQNIDFEKKKQNYSWGLYQRIEGEKIKIYIISV